MALSGGTFGEISAANNAKPFSPARWPSNRASLLLDEPTANLDLGWRERIVATVQRLHAETAITIVLVCHELEVLPPTCRHVVLLDHGRVLAASDRRTIYDRTSRGCFTAQDCA